MIATIATIAPTDCIDRGIAEYRLYRLRANYNRIVRWHAKVDQAFADADGVFERVVLKGRPPSKQVKYDMYGDAYAVARLIGLDVSNSVRDLNGVATVIAAASRAGYTPTR